MPVLTLLHSQTIRNFYYAFIWKETLINVYSISNAPLYVKGEYLSINKQF